MNQNTMFAGSSRVPLNTTLKEASLFSPPDVYKPHADEQRASMLIENVKKQYRRVSPFAWMGQPFPDEYREMVAADV